MSQARALVVLLFRHWVRASLPNRARKSAGRRASAGLFRLGYLGLMSGSGYGVTLAVMHLGSDEQRIRAAAWVVVGVVGLGLVWSGLTRGPTLRGEPSPLETPFLDVLPLRETSRLAVGLVERIFVHALAISCAIGLATDAPGRALALALLLATSGVVVGEAGMRVARVLVPPMMVARARAYLLVFGQLGFLMTLAQAPSLGRSQRLGVLVKGWPTAIARALMHGTDLGRTLGGLAAVIVLGAATIAIAERVGYDKIELVPTGRPKRAQRELLVVDRIDEILRPREPGGRLGVWLMMVYAGVVTAGMVVYAWTVRSAPAIDPSAAIRLACGVAAFGAFLVTSTRASRMASRDVAARPLLAPLPIEPRALLGGKVVRLRRDALTVCAPLVALLATPWSVAQHVETVWRVAGIAIAVALAAKAAAAIAFLTVGAGSKKGPMGGFVIESVLVLVPLLGVATASAAWAIVVPLLALGFVAREAGNSALGCVRWIDDGDDFERETPIWRALLVLAAYQSVAVLTERLVDLAEAPPHLRATLVTGSSALVLGLLTLAGRRDAPPMKLAARVPLLGAGLALGLAAGALALAWHRFVFAFAPIPAVAVLLLVPAEEAFFRGWLLPCIEKELERRWLAPVLGAFAFAAVHPPLAFVPTFALGYVASVLYLRTRSLAPGLAAHLVYAGIVWFLAR